MRLTTLCPTPCFGKPESLDAMSDVQHQADPILNEVHDDDPRFKQCRGLEQDFGQRS